MNVNKTLMRFYPYDKFIIESNLTLDQAVTSLKKSLSPKLKWYEYFNFNGDFIGEVSSDGFKIQKYFIFFRDKLATPVISGKFNSECGRLTVMIRIRINLFTLPVIIVLFGMIITMLWGLLTGEFPSESNTLNILLVIFSCSLFLYLMVTLPFLFQTWKIRKLLANIFQGQIKEIS